MAQTAKIQTRPVNDPVDPTDHTHNPKTERGVHPAAAPLGTDEEAGRQAPREPNPEAYQVNSQGEVRAGPGDAGRQDAPRVLDNRQDKPKRSAGTTIVLLLVTIVIVALLLMFAV